MKILLTTLLLASLSFADSFKVMPYVSTNFSDFTSTYSIGDTELETTFDRGFGFGGGVGAEITLVPMLLNLRTGLDYSLAVSTMDDSSEGEVDEDVTTFTKIGLPLVVVAQAGPIYGGLGVQIDYILAAENENTYESVDFPEDNGTTTADLKDGEFVGSLDYSLQLIAGYELAGVGPGSINLELFYNLGLANIAHSEVSDSFEVNTSAFGLRVGLALGI